jgi:hypothetical protein
VIWCQLVHKGFPSIFPKHYLHSPPRPKTHFFVSELVPEFRAPSSNMCPSRQDPVYPQYNKNVPSVCAAAGYGYPQVAIPPQPPSHSVRPNSSAPQTDVPVFPPNQYPQTWGYSVPYSATSYAKSAGYLGPPPNAGLTRGNAVHGKVGYETRYRARCSNHRSQHPKDVKFTVANGDDCRFY